MAPGSHGGVDRPVQFHDSRDFDWEELRARAEPLLQVQQREAAAQTTITSSAGAGTQGQIDGWDKHFQRHADAPVPFFKERRGLLEEFPLLKAPGIHILEVGSGNGSSVLPVLKHNATATVHATDPSPTAVDDTHRRVDEAGLASRLTTEVQRAPTIPCSPQYGPFDVVMIHCTLSAIPGNDDAAILSSASALLRPGGAVLIRDHGLYDMRHLKDMQRGAALLDHVRPAYLRPGGMHRRYYSLENMAELAAAAGLSVEENRYLCIRQHNAKRGIHMDRVYVHAVFRSSDAASPRVTPAMPQPQPQPLSARNGKSGQASERSAAAASLNAIRACGGDAPAALQILDEMHKALGSVDMFAVSAALAVCGKGGYWEKAIELFHSLPQPDLVACHAALTALQRCGRGEEAEQLLVRMQGLCIDCRRPAAAMDLRCLNTALRAYQRMVHLSWQKSPALQQSEPAHPKLCPQALHLLESAKERFGVSPSAESFAIVAEICLISGDFVQAKALHDAGCSLYPSVDDMPEDQHRVLANLEAQIWKSWSHRQLKLVLDMVVNDASAVAAAHSRERCDGGRADSVAWRELSASLSTALTEGVMPQGFGDAGARAGYTIARLIGRSQKVADALLSDSSKSCWLRRALLHQIFATCVDADSANPPASPARDKCRLLSFGGGPGFDYIAVALVADFFCLRGSSAAASLPVQALITDYEAGWRVDAACVARAVDKTPGSLARVAMHMSTHSAHFETADITQPLAGACNGVVADALRDRVAAPTLFIFSYVIAENVVLLREHGFVFLRDLARMAPPGALFLMTETTHHLWPEVLQAAALGLAEDPVYATSQARCNPLRFLQVVFPRITRKRGYSLCFRKPLPAECPSCTAACEDDGDELAPAAKRQPEGDRDTRLQRQIASKGESAVDWLERKIELSTENKRLLRLFQHDNQVRCDIHETPERERHKGRDQRERQGGVLP